MNPKNSELSAMKALLAAEKEFQKTASPGVMKKFRGKIIELQNLVASQIVERGRMTEFRLPYIQRGGRVVRRYRHYNAGDMAVHPDRPWQVVSEIGSLLGFFADERCAKVAVELLWEDLRRGNLPCNITQWHRYALYWMLQFSTPPEKRDDDEGRTGG